MVKDHSDYIIQKLSDKAQIYRKDSKIWWSAELKCWLVTDADAIKEILNNKKFEVPSYSVAQIVSKLSVNLEHNEKIVHYFPLAQENEAHKVIRKRQALQTAKNSHLALKNFEIFFTKRLQALIGGGDVATINLYDDLLLPSVNVLLGTLAEIDPENLFCADSISQILDETLPLRIRIKLNQRIGELIDLLPNHLSADEKYFRISMVALASDSLLGTLSSSLVSVIQSNQDKPLSEIMWPDNVPVTGVPVIQRVLAEDCEFKGRLMQAGQEVRLFLDAAGYIESEMPDYSSLYFGAGRHICPGMSVGTQVWRCMGSIFENINKKMSIQAAAMRNYDNVFNLYNAIEVKFYD